MGKKCLERIVDLEHAVFSIFFPDYASKISTFSLEPSNNSSNLIKAEYIFTISQCILVDNCYSWSITLTKHLYVLSKSNKESKKFIDHIIAYRL